MLLLNFVWEFKSTFRIYEIHATSPKYLPSWVTDTVFWYHTASENRSVLSVEQHTMRLDFHHSQRTQDVESMFVWRWSSVVDGGPTLNQHWFNVLCLLGWVFCPNSGPTSQTLSQRWLRAQFLPQFLRLQDCKHDKARSIFLGRGHIRAEDGISLPRSRARRSGSWFASSPPNWLLTSRVKSSVQNDLIVVAPD